LEYHNFDLSTLIGHHFSTLCENLVRFGSVIRILRRKKLYSRRRKFYWGNFSYVHEGARLSTAVISNLVFYKYSLGDDTTTPSGLYARLCHAFLILVLFYCNAWFCAAINCCRLFNLCLLNFFISLCLAAFSITHYYQGCNKITESPSSSVFALLFDNFDNGLADR